MLISASFVAVQEGESCYLVLSGVRSAPCWIYWKCAVIRLSLRPGREMGGTPEDVMLGGQRVVHPRNCLVFSSHSGRKNFVYNDLSIESDFFLHLSNFCMFLLYTDFPCYGVIYSVFGCRCAPTFAY